MFCIQPVQNIFDDRIKTILTKYTKKNDYARGYNVFKR